MIAAMKMARMQPASTAADIVPQITFDPWTASPMRVLGVSAVADGDERHDTAPDIAAADGDERYDASPDTGAASPERPGVTEPRTRDDHGDRSTAPAMIACPIRSRCTSLRARPDRP